MPYQLFFLAPPAVAPDRAAFERYFSRRDRYRVQKGRATYHNDETGVGFVFAHENVQDEGQEPRAWASVAVDYVRPSFFAEEATRELEPFVAQFGAAVSDPAAPGFTSYLTPTFLERWDRGNRDACGRYPASAPLQDRPLTLPRTRLLAAWQWNYRRRSMQESEQDGLFVPKVWFIAADGDVATSIIWPDAMPLRAPQVDYVIFSRETLAPGGHEAKRADVAVAPWSAVASSVTGQAFYDGLLVSWRVTDPRILTGLAHKVARLPGAAQMPAMVASDKVLDREGFLP
jgi:hypothetical protein